MTKWKVYENPNGRQSFAIEWNDTGECTVAEVETTNTEWDTVQEDGYLLARAPELQEALQALVNGIQGVMADEKTYQTMRGQFEPFQQTRLALGQAKLALEWAKGPAPWDTVVAPTPEMLAVS